MTRALAVATTLAALSLPAWGQDFQVGARARGMGGSYTAFEDDPVSVWMNPAGIARQEFSAAVQYQSFTQYELERESAFVGALGKPEAGLTDPAVVPSFAGIVAPLQDDRDHAFAFALVRPFENRLTYDFPAPPAATAQTEQQFWRFRFAYARGFVLGEESQVLPRASFGIAADVAYTRFEFKSSASSGLAIDHILDTHVAPGFGVGVLVTLFDDFYSIRLDAGAAYQSAVDFNLQQDEAVFASWDWPSMVNGGFVLYLLGQTLRFTFDVQWIGWDRATEDSDDPASPSIEDATNFSAGVEYQFQLAESVWILPRAGYRLYDAPWEDEKNLPALALTKLSIDTDSERFSIATFGFGFRWAAEGGKFRGVDVGVEVGGEVTNWSVGYSHVF